MCTFIICSEWLFFLTVIAPNTGLLCLFCHDFCLTKTKQYKKKKYIFHLGLLNILELKIKSGINRHSGINLVSFVHIFLHNFSEISWFLPNSGISFIVMANTEFLPEFNKQNVLSTD